MLSIKEKLSRLQGDKSPACEPLPPKSSAPEGLSELELKLNDTSRGPVWLRQRYITAALAPMLPWNDCRELTPTDLVLLAKSWAFQDIRLEDILFFDTETTGLAGGAGTCAFMVGMARWDGNGLNIRQYFLLNQGHEQAMLQAIGEEFQNARAILSFNGKSYDIPLLKNRFILNRLEFAWGHYPHLDLLHAARRLWKGLPGYALSILEPELLGFRRSGDIPGFQIPEIYFRAMRSGNILPLKGVFQHNVMDLISLLGLLVQGKRRFLNSAGIADADATGVVRTLIDLGMLAQAERVCQDQLENSRDVSWRMLQQQHTRLLKRQKKYAQAALGWEAWIAKSAEFDLEPYEELAKYQEHIARDIDQALQTTERACQRLEIRRQLRASTGKPDKEYETLLKRKIRLQNKRKNQDHMNLNYSPPKTRMRAKKREPKDSIANKLSD